MASGRIIREANMWGRDFLHRVVRWPNTMAMVWSVAAATSGRGITLVMMILIARQMGPHGYGTFSFALGAAIITAQLGTLGWPMLVTKLIPQYSRQQDWGRLRGLRFSADLVIAGSMIIISIALAGTAFAFMDRDNPLFMGLLIASLLSLPSGFRLLGRQQLAAIGRAPSGIFFDETVAPLIIITVILLTTLDEMSIFLTYAAATYLSAAGTRLLYKRWAPKDERQAQRTIELRNWMAVSLPMCVVIVTRVALSRIEVLVLAPFGSVYEVGLYNAAFALTFVASLLPSMINGVIRPLLSTYHGTGQFVRLRRIMRIYYLISFLASAAISLVIFAFAPLLISLTFGPEFEGAVILVRILAVSAVFFTLTETSLSYLLMCGHHNSLSRLGMVTLVASIILNVIFVPAFGAFATASINLGMNVIMFAVAAWIVHRAIRHRA